MMVHVVAFGVHYTMRGAVRVSQLFKHAPVLLMHALIGFM